MSQGQVTTTRFDFNVICAGLTRLIGDVKLTDRFWEHIDPEYFFFGDKSLKVRGFREILKEYRKVCEAGEIAKMTVTYLKARIRSGFDSEERAEARNLYDWMFSDEEIRKMSIDEGTFGIFLDYIKVLHLLKWSKPFMSDYRDGNIGSAVESMRDLLPKIDQVKIAEDYKFKTADIAAMLPQETNNVTNTLYLGCPLLDSRMGGFEPQTLNVFLSVTNGGKSMMMQHLIRMCVLQKKTMHLTVVEDRPKSVIRRLVASITGITINRLKNEFHVLTSQELAAIDEAKKLIDEYIEIDFVYGEGIDSIHKRKLDYDQERKRRGQEPYLVDVVDYTQHVAHQSAGDKKYEKVHRAYSTRKDFCLKNNKIGFDFAQINREGLHRLEDENHFLTHADIAGGFDLSAVCDTITSINRTSKQRDANRATLYVCKGKDSENNLRVEVVTDFARARWDMKGGTADLMNAHTRNEVMAQAVSEIKTGHDTL